MNNATFEHAINVPPTADYYQAGYFILFYRSIQIFANVYEHGATFFDYPQIGENLKLLFDKYNPNWIQDVGWVFAGALGLSVWKILYSKIVLSIMFKLNMVLEKNSTRFIESFYSFTFYSVAFGLSFWIDRSYGYLTHPERLWIGYSLSNPIPFSIKMLYLLEGSHYVHCLISEILFMNSLSRKDSIIMVFHHLVALALIGIAYFNRTAQLGVPLLCLFDICDVIMEGCKCLLKLNLQLPPWVKYICFSVLFCVWLPFRLYLFPLKSMYPALLYLTYNDIERWIPFSFSLFALSLFIVAMNAYWGLLMLKVLFKALRGGDKELEDIREVEDENENENAAKSSDSKLKKRKTN